MNKILIIQTASIGDVVLATAIAEKLHRLFPTARIDFLLRKGNESLFNDHPYLTNILIFDKKKHKVRQLFRLIRQLHREKYDVVINLQRFFTSGLITSLSSAKQKIGFNKNPLSLFFTHRLPHQIGTKSHVHEVERNLSLIAHLGDNSFQKPRLYPPAFHHAKLPEGTEYLCMAPASLWFTKQFPEIKWVELISKCSKELFIVLTGSKDDYPLCERIKDAVPDHNIINLAGELALLETAALIAKARMTIVNDSAAMHIATSVNAPVAAIFCSTVPAFGFTPLSDISFVIEVKEDPECRPCGLHGKNQCPKKHFRCADINVDSLLRKIGINEETVNGGMT